MNMNRLCRLCTLVLLTTSCSGGWSGRGTDIIALAKTATGGEAWDRIEIWHETGTVSSEGAVSRYEHWTDLRSLATRNVAASAPAYMMFDGRAAYQCMNTECNPMTEAESAAIKSGEYVAGFGFFFPDRFPAEVHSGGTRHEHGSQFDVVEVSPVGLDPIELWVDRNTHYIVRIVYGLGQFHTDFSDYRRVTGGVTVPFVGVDGQNEVKTETVRFQHAGVISFSPVVRQ
jgi:hypothetical protein